MENPNKISDQNLIEELKNSFIEDSQKEQLMPLVSDMTEEDRADLLRLINESKVAYGQAQEGEVPDEELAKLNEDFENQLNQLVQNTTREAYAEYEKLEEKEGESELKNVEAEMSEIEAVSVKDQQGIDKSDRRQLAKKSHFLMKLFFILIILFVLAGGAIWLMNTYK